MNSSILNLHRSLHPQVANRDANTLTGEMTYAANAVYKNVCTYCSYAATWTHLFPSICIIYLLSSSLTGC